QVGVHLQVLQGVEDPAAERAVLRRRGEVGQRGGIRHGSNVPPVRSAPCGVVARAQAPSDLLLTTMAPPLRPRRSTDTPPPPGVTRTAAGTEVAVVAAHATSVELCLFDGAHERRIPLRHRAHDTWWDAVPELTPGTRYGF